MANPQALHELLALRERHLETAAHGQHMPVMSANAVGSPPMVLFLGNHSSGKSSMINHLLGRRVQRTGVAPTDDGFTVLMHAEDQRSVDGQALCTNPRLPFTDLASFGPGLTEHLEGRYLDSELLRHVRLIDSPGMIDGAGPNTERPYDFTGVVRWFATQADLVLLFFDPEKPGTTGETIQTLTAALTGIDHKLRIVMNKMDLFDGIRDFARTYGALCWNLSRCLPTKDLPHIYTTIVPELVREDAELPLEGFAAALLELESYINDLPQRRIDTVISRTMDEVRALLLRGRVCDSIRRRIRWARTQVFLLGSSLAAAGAASSAWLWNSSRPWWWSICAAGAGLILFVISMWLRAVIGARSERHAHANLDSIFRRTFRLELSGREYAADLQHQWQRVRPGLRRSLNVHGIEGIRRLGKAKQRRLQKLLDDELPRLR